MVALITLGHGSRHGDAPRGVDTLAAAAGDLLRVPAHAAYLDLNEPLLIDAARALAATHHHAVVVPLLFTRAYHSRVDVPSAVAEAHAASGLNLTLAHGLGVGQDMAQLLAWRVRRDAPTDADIALYSVGTSCDDANRSVANLADDVAELTGRRVWAVAATRGTTIGDVAAQSNKLHILPLFVTSGLLLDKVDIRAPHVTVSPPLGSDLAGIVAARYRDCVPVPA